MKQGYDVIGDRTRDLAHQRPRTNQPFHPWSLILALTELPAWDSQSVHVEKELIRLGVILPSSKNDPARGLPFYRANCPFLKLSVRQVL